MYRDHRLDTIVTHAWETWTRNGATCWDRADREVTADHVRGAVEATYAEGITDEDWLRAALRWLDNYEPPTLAIQDEPDFPGWADNH